MLGPIPAGQSATRVWGGRAGSGGTRGRGRLVWLWLLNLPTDQGRFVWAIRITGVELMPTAAANPRTVVVIDGAAPVLMP